MKSQHEITEQLLRYLEDEADPAERAALEAQLARDLVLREQLDAVRLSMEAARDWANLEVPGIARAEQLPIPRLQPACIREMPSAAPVRRIQRTAWQIVAAAAVFVAGFMIGSNTKAPSPQGGEQSTIGRHAPTSVAQPTPESAVPAAPAEPRYATDENGRVVVETVAAGSGTRATWVVDGRFQLAAVSATQRTDQ